MPTQTEQDYIHAHVFVSIHNQYDIKTFDKTNIDI